MNRQLGGETSEWGTFQPARAIRRIPSFVYATLGNLCDKLPTLGAGEALLIGESVVMPSLVKVQRCDPPPSSTDIPYYQLWKEEWKQLNFEGIKKAWLKE
jgi:hypothetical protein